MNWLTIFAPILGVLLFWWFVFPRFNRKPANPDKFGRVMIKPGAISWLCALFCLVLTISFQTFAVTEIMLKGDDLLFWTVLGLPLSCIFGFGVYVICFTRLRVSDENIEVKGLTKWGQYSWDDIAGVDYHPILGTRVQLLDGKSRYVWLYGYGTSQVADMFLSKNKPFVITP